MRFLLLLGFAATTTLAKVPPVSYLDPELLWNTDVQTPLQAGNAVQVSPDDAWLYVTSFDGLLSKLAPENGNYVSVYRPEVKADGWTITCQSGLSFHMDETDASAGKSFAVYAIVDSPPEDAQEAPTSRVIAIDHEVGIDALNERWIQEIDGVISGTPLVGSDGKHIYLTANAVPILTADPTSNRTRRTQEGDSSGKFHILSDDRNLDNPVYSYDSKFEFTITKHLFAPLGIAKNPAYGNYHGGEDNRQDVLMWGSRPGNETDQGETHLFQLPKDFNASEPDAYKTIRPVVLETVAWTTYTRPTFSDDGLDVFFARSGNQRLVGWNDGRAFDLISNVAALSDSSPSTNEVPPPVPIAVAKIANNDTILLSGYKSYGYGSGWSADKAFRGVNIVSGSTMVSRDRFSHKMQATPMVSPDGAIVFFASGRSLYAVNITDDLSIWESKAAYLHPDGSLTSPALADFSLSRHGEFLYYCHGGGHIAALRVAALVATTAPTEAPSNMPSVSPTVVPSESPTTATPSESPTVSASPSATVIPSVSNGPSESPSYEEDPSAAPTGVPTPNPTQGTLSEPTPLPTHNVITTGAPSESSTETAMSSSPPRSPTGAPTTNPSAAPTLSIVRNSMAKEPRPVRPSTAVRNEFSVVCVVSFFFLLSIVS